MLDSGRIRGPSHMLPRLLDRARRGARSLVGLAAIASTSVASASTDLTVQTIEPVQAVPGTTLVAGRATMVRVEIGGAGEVAPGEKVDGILRVFVDEVEADFSPVYSDNGPLPPPASADFEKENDTLNFVFLAPGSDDVELVVEINPPGPARVAEAEYGNNTASLGPLAFVCKQRPEIAYVPIDYRPSGGTEPNLPEPELVEPGVGDNFVQAIFPAADLDYHRSDAPSKLWTSELDFTYDVLGLQLMLDHATMVPQPDYLYGWVPGGFSVNGYASGIPGTAGFGNTQPWKHQRTFAHELGHLLGLSHTFLFTGDVGMDVEHHLKLTEALPRVKSDTLWDIMAPGFSTNEAWTLDLHWEHFAIQPAFECPAEPPPAPLTRLIVAGIWNSGSRSVTDFQALAAPSTSPTTVVPLAQADLVVRAWRDDGERFDFPQRARPATDGCSGGAGADSSELLLRAPFLVVLPEDLPPDSIVRVDVVSPAEPHIVLALLRRTQHPPVFNSTGTRVWRDENGWRVEADVVDADGDPLRHHVFYSPDGLRIVPLAASSEPEISVSLDGLPRFDPERGYLEVLSSDGLHTAARRLSVFVGPGTTGNPPWTHVVTPDEAEVYRKGATVVLHASCFDLEDRILEGSDVQWTSDRDGPIGEGRLTSTASLSVGVHRLTVTSTDGDGESSSDSVTIAITGRRLPGESCGPVVPFGDGGGPVLSYCGTSAEGHWIPARGEAELRLSQAPPSSLVILVAGPEPGAVGGAGPRLLERAEVLLVRRTDAEGRLELPNLHFRGAPRALHLQALVADPASPRSYALSNAVRVGR